MVLPTLKGVSSIEPDGGEEVASDLVVARGDGAELLELGEEVLEVPGLIEITVIVTGRLGVSFGRNDRRLAEGRQGVQYVSIRSTERLAETGIEPSVGSVGDSYDNALAESLSREPKAVYYLT